VHEDISVMPMGYHSLIGDMGSLLSNGQKQRIILVVCWLWMDAVVQELQLQHHQ